MLKEKMLLWAFIDKNEISLNHNNLISYILSLHIFYGFLDKDLQPDDGLVKRAETRSNFFVLKPIHKTSLLMPHEQHFIQTYHYNCALITEQNRGEQILLFHLAINSGLTSQFFHNKRIPTVRYTWISSKSTTKADGSRSGYVKTILLIPIVLLTKYFLITKSGINKIVLSDFVYCIFRQNINIT